MIKHNLTIFTVLISLFAFTQNEFAFKLYGAMEDEGNILFSPVSIKTAFAMAYEGANEKTQTEFERTFGFTEDNAAFIREMAEMKKVSTISNSIWIQDKYLILSSFIEKMKTSFDSKPYRTDFEKDPNGSAKKINVWIEKKTEGMIKDMVSPNDVKDFKMAIINAIYFKQNWKKTFDKEQTKKDNFTSINGTKSSIWFMHALDYYRAFEGEDEKVIELPYEDNKTSMVIILPHKMKKYEMTGDRFQQLNLKMQHQKVNLDLPKFTFETTTFELKPYLEKMGFKLAFTNAADFSDMREQNDIKIGTALHKAKIIVNEEGTEAAAATIIGMVEKTSISRPRPIMQMKVNRPFFYFIKDNKTNTILFMGRMNQL